MTFIKYLIVASFIFVWAALGGYMDANDMFGNGFFTFYGTIGLAGVLMIMSAFDEKPKTEEWI